MAAAEGRIETIHQFAKKNGEKHFYAQTGNSKIFESTSQPPAPIVGTFGDKIFESANPSQSRPASWDKVVDALMFSNGADQHRLYPGNDVPVNACFLATNFSTLTILQIEEAYDVSEEVREELNGEVASVVFNSTDDAIFIKTNFPATAFNFVFDTPNVIASTVALEVINNNSASKWVAQSVDTDGTITGGTTWGGQDGAMAFTPNGLITPTLLFGETGYWYRVRIASGSVTCDITSITYDTVVDFDPLENVFSGVLEDAIEVQVNDTTLSNFLVYPASSVSLDALVFGDEIFIASSDLLEGIYLDFGAAPSQTAVTGLTVARRVGGAWTAVTGLEDSTAAFLESGWLNFNRHSDADKFQFNDGQFNAYWYRIKWTGGGPIDTGTTVGITMQPFFNINRLGGIGNVSAAWKERGCYTFDKFPSWIYVAENARPNVLNGADFAILQAGDGRRNRIVAMKKFQNELMVWQEERGRDGGCLTLFEGFNPATFGKLLLSSKVGSFSPKSVVIVDGTLASTRRDDTKQTLAFFISHYGIFVTDGRLVTGISDPIQNYFDPRFAECIRLGYEERMWCEHDTSHNVVRFGLVSGASATECNVFPVWDLNDGTWSFDTYASGKELSCMHEVEADSGQFPILQYGGWHDTSFVVQLNTGLNDDSEAIDFDVRMEFNAQAKLMEFREFILRAKLQTGDLDFTMFKDGIIDTDSTEQIDLSIEEETGDDIRRERFVKGVYQDSNISIRLRNNVVDEDIYLYDFAVNLDILEDR